MRFEIEVSNIAIADTLCAGFEGGIQYWGRVKGRTVEELPDGEYWCSENKLLTGEIPFISIVEYEHHNTGAEDAKHQLTKHGIKNAVEIIFDKYPHHFMNVISGDGDATTGDVLIQCALFGEIIYG